MTADRPRHTRLIAWFIFLALLVIYQLNGGFPAGNDTSGNTYLPVAVLQGEGLSFTAENAPFMFLWQLKTGQGLINWDVIRWEDRVAGKSAIQMYRRGLLIPRKSRYYLVPALQPGRYVSAYGPVAGLIALPVHAATRLFDPAWESSSAGAMAIGKLVASTLVAASAVCIFLTARIFLPLVPAAGLACCYGLGTCVWCLSSQALWQQTPALFGAALGALALARLPAGKRFAALSGFAFALAAAARPTWVLGLGAAGLYLALTRPRALPPFLLAAAPILLALGCYNLHYFGTLTSMAQMQALNQFIVQRNIGRDAWQGNLLEGLAGILLSPSRGLFIYSPFLLAALWGACRAADPRYRFLWPLGVTMLILWLIQAQWFDWWGGWSFAYRSLVDTMPILVLFLLPVFATIWSRPLLATLFGTLLAFSIGVQVLGAFANNMAGWNNRQANVYQVAGGSEEVIVPQGEPIPPGARRSRSVALDVDEPLYRYRLWSWADNPLRYYLTHFRQECRARRQLMQRFIDNQRYYGAVAHS